jgi:hypothetical protein
VVTAYLSRSCPDRAFKKTPSQNGHANPCMHAGFFRMLECQKNISFVDTHFDGIKSTVAADALRFFSF